MLHSLYRAYLYGIIVVLLYFTAIATVVILSVLLEATPINGLAPATLTSSDVVQPAVFAIVSWILTLSVGGFHYWLLRRNQSSDGDLANDAVRAAFLNLSEGIAALVAVVAGIIAIDEITQNSGATVSFATLLVFAALFLLFEFERRRLPANEGASLEFQRLHLSGLQLIFLVFFILPSLLNAFSTSLYLILTNTGTVSVCSYGPGYTTYGPGCTAPGAGTSALSEWLVVGLVVLAWLIYWLLGLGDRSSNAVSTMHFLGYAAGVVVILVGLEKAFELVVNVVMGERLTGLDLVQPFDFISPLLSGLVIVGASILLLRTGRDTLSSERSGTTLSTALAVTATLVALPFWVGCIILVYDVLEHLVPGGSNPSLTTALALILTGVGYIPLELWLRSRTRRDGAASAPKRAFELALLAVGMLDTVISVILLLFVTLTAVLGNPLPGWQESARAAASGLAIGVVMLLIYGRQALAQRASQRVESKKPVVQVGAVVTPDAATEPISTNTIESILDELVAGHITRDQAAHQIRAL